MTSPQKVAANRMNARRSTGPRTWSGKARSATNSAKHGLTSMKPILISGEDGAELENFREGFEDSWRPVGVVEMSLVDRLVYLMWRLKRVEKIEAELLEREIHEEVLQKINGPAIPDFRLPARLFADLMPGSPLEESEIRLKRAGEGREVDSKMSLSSSFARLSSGGDLLGRLLRYEAALERSFFRTGHELERIQRRRLGEVLDAPQALDVDLRANIGGGPVAPNLERVRADHVDPTQTVHHSEGVVGQETGEDKAPSPRIPEPSENQATRKTPPQQLDCETNPPPSKESGSTATSRSAARSEDRGPHPLQGSTSAVTAPKYETKPNPTPASYRPDRHTFER